MSKYDDTYISGGYSKDQTLDQFLKFDFDTEEWSQDGNRIDQPRYHHEMSIFTTEEIDCTKPLPRKIISDAWVGCFDSNSNANNTYNCLEEYLTEALMVCVSSVLCVTPTQTGYIDCVDCQTCNSNCGNCNKNAYCWVFGCKRNCCSS